jgi:hypothetical protein
MHPITLCSSLRLHKPIRNGQCWWRTHSVPQRCIKQRQEIWSTAGDTRRQSGVLRSRSSWSDRSETANGFTSTDAAFRQQAEPRFTNTGNDNGSSRGPSYSSSPDQWQSSTTGPFSPPSSWEEGGPAWPVNADWGETVNLGDWGEPNRRGGSSSSSSSSSNGSSEGSGSAADGATYGNFAADELHGVAHSSNGVAGSSSSSFDPLGAAAGVGGFDSSGAGSSGPYAAAYETSGSWPFADASAGPQQQQQQQRDASNYGVPPPLLPSDITLIGRRDAVSHDVSFVCHAALLCTWCLLSHLLASRATNNLCPPAQFQHHQDLGPPNF